jgi:hypothetical protein
MEKSNLSLSDVMPESLSKKTGICPICKRNYSEHKHTDYFILPLHEVAIENFFLSLSKNLEIVRGHYRAYAGISRRDFRNHKKDGDLQQKTIERLLKDPSLYNDFINDYEEDTKMAYYKVQSEINWITNEILKHEKNVEDFRK